MKCGLTSICYLTTRSIYIDIVVSTCSIYSVSKLDELRALREANYVSAVRPAARLPVPAKPPRPAPVQVAATDCPMCAARRLAKAAAQRRWRAKQRTSV